MSDRSWAETAFALFAILLVGALVLGQLLGQPILLGYVTTGSMEPTIDAGDGFVVVPSALSGSVSEGDVIVFDAREIEGGGLTTHRVVEQTDDGYLTRGDANPFTDQDGGEPPVTDGQIVATAPEIRGNVIVVPHLGTAIMGVQSWIGETGERFGSPLAPESVGAILVGIGLLMFGFAALTGDTRGVRTVRRSSSRPNVVPVWMAVLLAVLLVTSLATAAMVLPAGTHEYAIVSSDSPSDRSGVIEPGGSEEVTYRIDNEGMVPMLVVLEPASEGVIIDQQAVAVNSGGTANATVVLTAPPSEGTYLRHVSEHRYLGVLPAPVLLRLHAVSPLLSLLVVNTIVAGIVVSLSVALFGTGHLRLRAAGAHVPFSVRLRRRFG